MLSADAWSRTKRLIACLGVISVLTVTAIAAWRPDQNTLNPPDAVITGAAYQPWKGHGGPNVDADPTREEVEADMAALAALGVRRVRTYSSIGAAAHVPAAAAKYGMTVLQGVWVGTDPARRREEVDAGVRLAAANPNIAGMVVGSEALLRADATEEDLMTLAREVRARTGRPTGIAELWADWEKRPHMARAVDFAVIHVLPYWDSIRNEAALEWARSTVERVQRALPGTRVVVGETGWPTRGVPTWDSQTGIEVAGNYVRRYFDWANRAGVESYIMEAYDGPWKTRIEGSVGPYWGFLDAERRLKYPLVGPIQVSPHWKIAAAFTVAAGGLALLVALAFTRWRGVGLLLAGASGALAGHLAAWSAAELSTRYFSGVEAIGWTLTGLLLLILALIFGTQISEAAGMLDRGRGDRAVDASVSDELAPAISIHMPTHNEPPEVVIESLEALARLDWPVHRLEVIVLDNNTPDEITWRPVQKACLRLNARLGRDVFRFFHLDGVKGYKAGALCAALERTREDAEAIAVVDADYVVSPDWLRRAAFHLSDPVVGLVQAPQDHRDKDDTSFKRWIAYEYDGFFHQGMVERARDNAIVMHGTMALLRRSALEGVGGWSSRTITEDAEMGLRLQAAGWRCSYIRASLGCGLMPDDMASLKTQRIRWAYGGARIAVEHAHLIFGRGSCLSAKQRLRWLAGWAPWAGEAASVAFSVLAAAWTTLYLALPKSIFQLPEPVQYVPAMLAAPIALVLLATLHRVRVPCRRRDTLRAVLAGMALAPTHGIGFLRGLIAPGLPFRRTPKAAGQSRVVHGLRSVAFEATMAVTLLTLAVLVAYYWPYGPWEFLWACSLTIQSVPYVAAVALAVLPTSKPATAPTAQRLRVEEDTSLDSVHDLKAAA